MVNFNYLPTPKKLKGRRFIWNIRCNDGKSFVYSVLASLFPVKKNGARPGKYNHHINKLNMDDINYPVQLSDIQKFEEQNGD